MSLIHLRRDHEHGIFERINIKLRWKYRKWLSYFILQTHVRLSWKFPWKSCSTTHLPFLSSNPKILKAFRKTFPPKMKSTKCPAKGKKKEKINESRRGEERKREKKAKTTVSLLHPRTIWEANILHLDQKTANSTTCKQLCGKF